MNAGAADITKAALLRNLWRVAGPILQGVTIPMNQDEPQPKNLVLQARHRILTGVPSPGTARLLVSAVNGTSFRFSVALKSSLVSLLPHFGQRAEKTLNFGGRFRFMGDVGHN